MNELQKLTHEILTDAFIMSLGTTDGGGPWVAPVIYVFDSNFNLYWLSVPQVRHSQALLKNPHVACSIVADSTVGSERALQIEGTAAILEEYPLDLEQMLQRKRGKPIPTVARETLSPSQRWYKLTPTKIEVTNNEKFGYKKQNVL